MTPKEKILAEIARSRAAIARDGAAVRNSLDFASKIKGSVRTRPFSWLGGATAIGYILAGSKIRTKTLTQDARGKISCEDPAGTKKPRGFFGLLFGFVRLVFSLLRPALSAYAARRFSALAEKLAK